MATTSKVYTGLPLLSPENTAIISGRVFPVSKEDTVETLRRNAGNTATYDVLVEAQFNYIDGSAIWSVQIPASESDDSAEFHLPADDNWGMSDLDPFEGQVRYEEIARTVEGRLGRTGLTILVS